MITEKGYGVSWVKTDITVNETT